MSNLQRDGMKRNGKWRIEEEEMKGQQIGREMQAEEGELQKCPRFGGRIFLPASALPSVVVSENTHTQDMW